MSFTNSYFGFATQSNTEDVDVGPKENAADALVLQEVTAKTVRQDARSILAAGDTKDISELFGGSEDEVEPEVETRTSRQQE